MRKSHVDDVPAEPIFYEDGVDWRIVDLRPYGVDCIPLLSFGCFSAVRPGVTPHVHPGCVEICLSIKGNVRYESCGVVYPVLPGHVFLSRPNEPHRRCDNPKGMTLYRALFALPRKGKGMLGLSARESADISDAILAIPMRLFHSTKRLRAAFDRLFTLLDPAKARDSWHRIEMRHAALELLLSIVEAPLAPHSKNAAASSKVKAIARRIAESPERDYSIADMSREAGLSRFAFTEEFKRATGLPPHAYLLDRRVRRAAGDIRDRRLSVSVVADKWRFSSPQHFTTAFKRIMGVLPSQVG